jgi:hypothetical protein
LETLFEDGERVEGGTSSRDVKKDLYSFVDGSVLFLITFYKEALIFLLSNV